MLIGSTKNKKKIIRKDCFPSNSPCRDDTAAILVFQNNWTAVKTTNPVEIELFSYVKTFFCKYQSICMDVGDVSENAP